jgi:hypothetical protein
MGEHFMLYRPDFSMYLRQKSTDVAAPSEEHRIITQGRFGGQSWWEG